MTKVANQRQAQRFAGMKEVGGESKDVSRKGQGHGLKYFEDEEVSIVDVEEAWLEEEEVKEPIIK